MGTDVLRWCMLLQRSVAEVVWADRSRKNVYRVGHKGKVRDDYNIVLAGM